LDYENEKVRDILKQYSALKYGRDRKYVEAEIGARIGLDLEEKTEEVPGEGPVGDGPGSMVDGVNIPATMPSSDQ
jgi:hypothetical protein